MISYGMLVVFLSLAIVQGYSLISTNTGSVAKQGVYRENYPKRTLKSLLKFIEFAESNLKRYEPFFYVQVTPLTQTVETFFEKIRRSKISASMANTLLGIIIVDAKDMLTSQDCRDSAPRPTGVWYVSVGSMAPFKVLCNMEVDNGNWTVIQERLDGSVAFNRTWKEYKDGFGIVGKEFWLGNDKIHALTSSNNYELRVDISDWEGNSWYAIYDKFRMEDEALKYKLKIGSYSGTAGDSLGYHNEKYFTTLDNDNDSNSANCANSHGGGGWWYGSCDNSNLNGQYPEGSGEKGIEWTKARSGYSMKYSRMMIRRQ